MAFHDADTDTDTDTDILADILARKKETNKNFCENQDFRLQLT